MKEEMSKSKIWPQNIQLLLFQSSNWNECDSLPREVLVAPTWHYLDIGDSIDDIHAFYDLSKDTVSETIRSIIFMI